MFKVASLVWPSREQQGIMSAGQHSRSLLDKENIENQYEENTSNCLLCNAHIADKQQADHIKDALGVRAHKHLQPHYGSRCAVCPACSHDFCQLRLRCEGASCLEAFGTVEAVVRNMIAHHITGDWTDAGSVLFTDVLVRRTCRLLPWLDKTWAVCLERVGEVRDDMGLVFAWVRKLFINRKFGLTMKELQELVVTKHEKTRFAAMGKQRDADAIWCFFSNGEKNEFMVSFALLFLTMEVTWFSPNLSAQVQKAYRNRWRTGWGPGSVVNQLFSEDEGKLLVDEVSPRDLKSYRRHTQYCNDWRITAAATCIYYTSFGARLRALFPSICRSLLTPHVLCFIFCEVRKICIGDREFYIEAQADRDKLIQNTLVKCSQPAVLARRIWKHRRFGTLCSSMPPHDREPSILHFETQTEVPIEDQVPELMKILESGSDKVKEVAIIRDTMRASGLGIEVANELWPAEVPHLSAAQLRALQGAVLDGCMVDRLICCEEFGLWELREQLMLRAVQCPKILEAAAATPRIEAYPALLSGLLSLAADARMAMKDDVWAAMWNAVAAEREGEAEGALCQYTHVKGVYWHKPSKQWQVYIRRSGDIRSKYAGICKTHETAVKMLRQAGEGFAQKGRKISGKRPCEDRVLTSGH